MSLDNIRTLFTDSIYFVLAVNCTFETGFCAFHQEATDDFDWTRTNVSSPTAGTGPDRDHTTGTGKLPPFG